jgi:hypothetical protein
MDLCVPLLTSAMKVQKISCKLLCILHAHFACVLQVKVSEKLIGGKKKTLSL